MKGFPHEAKEWRRLFPDMPPLNEMLDDLYTQIRKSPSIDIIKLDDLLRVKHPDKYAEGMNEEDAITIVYGSEATQFVRDRI